MLDFGGFHFWVWLFAAIEACKQQLSGTTTEYNLNGQSECSEQTSSDAPVLEEFIPLKRASSSHTDGEEQESKKRAASGDAADGKSCKKSDWLRSVQLWNQTPDPHSNEVVNNFIFTELILSNLCKK